MGMYLGSTEIKDVRLGAAQLKEVCVGNTEVWSEGGGGPTDWGTIRYYSVFSIGYEISFAKSCTVNSIDADELTAFMSQRPNSDTIAFVYDNGWICNREGDPIPTEDMPAVTGVNVTLDSGATEAAQFSIRKTAVVNTTSSVVSATLTQNEYNNLNDTVIYAIGGISVPKNAVKEVVIGTLATSTPVGFLSVSENLENIDFTYADSLTAIDKNFLAGSKINQSLVFPSTLTSIGNSFMDSCSDFNQLLVLPNSVTSIGNRFMGGCSSFNQPLVLPSSLATIGQGFMTGCTSFNQPLTLPDSVTSIGRQFLNNCYSLTATIDLGTRPVSITYGSKDDSSSFTVGSGGGDAPAFITGMTIVGTYAADWKAKYPDKNLSYSHRKLLIG